MKKPMYKFFVMCLSLLFASQISIAQTEEAPRKKQVKIVTKTIDENGNEKVTVNEQSEISDEEIDRLIQEAIGEENSIDVEVEGKTKIRIIEQDIEVEKDGKEKKVMIFKSEDGEVTELKGDEVRIIKKKINNEGGMTIDIEGMEGEDEMIWIDGREEGESGDVIFIEEEITEEMDEDGKVVKKTVKKKKKIVKKEKGN